MSRILLCDDQPSKRQDAERLIRYGLGSRQSEIEIIVWSDDELKLALQSLFDLVEEGIDGNTGRVDGTPFDGFDVVLLDNNLSHIRVGEGAGVRLTAEVIAGYIRAFSTAGYIVSLNKNPDVDFDLRYMVGDYQSRADLAVNTEHLGLEGLWSDNRQGQEFAPSYWPPLLTTSSKRRAQLELIQSDLDRPVLATLGFPEAAIGALSRHAGAALGPNLELSTGQVEEGGVTSEKLSFAQFFLERGFSIPAKDDRAALYKKGYRLPVERVVAAEIDRWMRREVIGPQAILVDLPHLVARMPFLLGKGAAELGAWNNLTEQDAEPFGLDADLYETHLKPHLYPQWNMWWHYPLFWWPLIDQDEDLKGIYFSVGVDWGDFVFCEDISQFKDRDAKGEPPRSFVTEFEGPWGNRYISYVRGKQYSPRTRLAL